MKINPPPYKMSTNNITTLFGLPDTEKIYDDFSCKEGFAGAGRLYLLTNYLCFFSKMIRTKKIVKSWTQITSIVKKNGAGV